MLGGFLYRGLARPRAAWVIALVLAVATASGVRPARAQDQDQIAELTKTLSSSSEKARLAAAVALGNLGDRRTMKPLVTALSDSSPQIRLVAATGLGKLGHKSALPALKGAANDDADEKVRKAAHDAAIAVAKANDLPSPWPEPEVIAARQPPGFGKQPRALGPTPDLYVLVNSSADDSPGKADKSMRKEHAEIARKTLVDECKSHPVITTVASDAKRLGLDARQIDLSVLKFDVATVGATIEVAAELQLAVSDSHGKMLSFLSGGAKIQVPKHKFDARYLPRLRREVLESAVRGMFEKLLVHLHGQRTTS
jgi:HEAT repeat protein